MLLVATLAIVPAALAAAALVYVVSIAFAARWGVARTAGTVGGLALEAPVRIVRDERDVPHIHAANPHDLYFAQGYVTGSDRLFQIDLTRRFVYGRLAELLGAVALETDERSRLFDPAAIVAKQFAGLGAAQRAELEAFAQGVNAAAQREPRPPEYAVLLAGFAPWRPQDSLACALAIVRDLSDGWDDVIARDAVVRTAGEPAIDAFYSLTDPAYDVPTAGGKPAAIPPLPALRDRSFGAAPAAAASTLAALAGGRGDLGSNAFAAGAARTATGRALLANDPHLEPGIPGIWHLVDLSAPGLHAAGATLAGTPGVILGHNEHIAWGATNGTVAGVSVFAERFNTSAGDDYAVGAGRRAATVRIERFKVRFGGERTRRYLSTRHGFVVEPQGLVRHAVTWDAVTRPIAALTAFDGLAHAADLDAAWRALANYPGPTQNFVLADDAGRAGYTLAGAIPIGPWGLRVAEGSSDAAQPPARVPFSALPHVAPTRAAVIVTANNLPYGAGYPYRLSAQFSPPYRAAEITRRLRAVAAWDPAAFAAIQADTQSIADRELARRAAAALRARSAYADAGLAPAYAALAGFDGRFEPDSRGATVVERLRDLATVDLVYAHLPPAAARAYFAESSHPVTLMRALRERPRGWFAGDDPDGFLVAQVRALVARYGRDLAAPYGEVAAVTAQHPLAAFGLSLWNGPRLPGRGGRFAPAVQAANLGQSFRAVWDVGNWDAGGIDIPLGESGEPGSPHYRDLASRYARHVLTPLPFSGAAVARAARSTLVLTP